MVAGAGVVALTGAIVGAVTSDGGVTLAGVFDGTVDDGTAFVGVVVVVSAA